MQGERGGRGLQVEAVHLQLLGVLPHRVVLRSRGEERLHDLKLLAGILRALLIWPAGQGGSPALLDAAFAGIRLEPPQAPAVKFLLHDDRCGLNGESILHQNVVATFSLLEHGSRMRMLPDLGYPRIQDLWEGERRHRHG
jgi:hypothetical protein